MKNSLDAIAVIDPFSAGAPYGIEARRLGFRPLAVLSSADLPSYYLSTFRPQDFDGVLQHKDMDATVSWLKERDIRALLPGTQSALGLVDMVADRLGVPGNSLATSSCRLDKAMMKFRLQEQDVPCASFVEGDRLDDLCRWGEAKGYPVVAKPPEGLGTKGVRVCRERRELETAFHYIMSLPGLYHGGRRRVLVEEYLDGDEYFMNFLHCGGLRRLICFARYEKIQTEDSAGIYKNIYSLPLDSPEVEALATYVRRVNEALDVQLGINDVEFKLTRKGPRFIELNNRLPGAGTPDMIQRCTGFNCYKENFRLFLGELSGLSRPINYHRHFCICCLISEDSGELAGIEGLGQVRRLPSFDGVKFYRNIGDPIERTTDLLSTWGLVFLIHEDPEVLRGDADSVHRTLKAIVENNRHSSRRES
jgi:biotin carboxylase